MNYGKRYFEKNRLEKERFQQKCFREGCIFFHQKKRFFKEEGSKEKEKNADLRN